MGLVVWMALTFAVVASGALRVVPMPGIPHFLGTVVVTAAVFGMSRIGRLLAVGLPIWALVAFHGFRLPLELVLHSWATQGTIPETMTWSGRNFDIISGIAALVATPLAAKWRAAAWVANGVGIVMLLNVARGDVMSWPLPRLGRGASAAAGHVPPLCLDRSGLRGRSPGRPHCTHPGVDHREA